jgi:hypothetical protein
VERTAEKLKVQRYIMWNVIRKARHVALQRFRNFHGEYSHPLINVKLKLIDHAVKIYGIKSFVDAGGCWGVHGGYTFHALSKFNVDKAFLIDTHITDTARKRSSSCPNLELLSGDFGSDQLVGTLGTVDAVILFDVLLHQVNPDWDKIIEMYSRITDNFIIYNQMFIGSHKTIRLIDLGEQEYLKNTPYKGMEDFIRELFENLDQKHPEHNKTYGESHHYWQWGITPPDLFSIMSKFDFRADYVLNYGKFGDLPHFENHGFLFSRVKRYPSFSRDTGE